jgi:hypothetical protein
MLVITFQGQTVRRIRTGVALLTGCGLCAAVARGGDVSWINPFGGSWEDGSNWSAGSPPAPGDRALFVLDSEYSVGLSQSVAVELASAELSAGLVSLDLYGQTLTLEAPVSDRLSIGTVDGAFARLRVIGGTLALPFVITPTWVPGFINVGVSTGSGGRFELSGSEARHPMTGGIHIGGAGTGEVIISDGAVASDTMTGGGFAAWITLATGSSMTVTGEGSGLNVRNFDSTGGTINILSGARANAEAWHLAGDTKVQVSDGALLTCENAFIAPSLVLDGGDARINYIINVQHIQVAAGGSLQLNASGPIGRTDILDGTVIVSQPVFAQLVNVGDAAGAQGAAQLVVNSSLQSVEPIEVFANGTVRGGGWITGALQVHSGGRVSPHGNDDVLDLTDLRLESGSSFDCTIADADHADRLDISGSVFIVPGANLEVSVDEIFPLSPLGQTYLIINNSGDDPIFGTFAGLPAGVPVFDGLLQFSLNYDFVGGEDGVANDAALTLLAIPEPGAGALLAAAFACVLIDRRGASMPAIRSGPRK